MSKPISKDELMDNKFAKIVNEEKVNTSTGEIISEMVVQWKKEAPSYEQAEKMKPRSLALLIAILGTKYKSVDESVANANEWLESKEKTKKDMLNVLFGKREESSEQTDNN